MARTTAIRAIVVGALVGLAGCVPSPSGAPVLVEYGHSFGFCVGFCETRLHVDGSAVSVTMTDRRTGATATHTGSLTAEGAATMALLAAAVDAASLRPVYGCPDCADGGATSLTLRTPAGDVATTFEHGNPPDALDALDAIGNEVLWALRSCRPALSVTVDQPCTAV